MPPRVHRNHGPPRGGAVLPPPLRPGPPRCGPQPPPARWGPPPRPPCSCRGGEPRRAHAPDKHSENDQTSPPPPDLQPPQHPHRSQTATSRRGTPWIGCHVDFGAHLPLMDFGGHSYTLDHLLT